MNGKEHIEELFAWVVVDDDGTEGIPAVGIGGADMVMPLYSSDRALAEGLRPVAREVARTTGRPLTLLRFTTREEIEQVYP